MIDSFTSGPITLHHGRWQDVLAGETCDFLCVDAPYSERTHAGHNNGHKQRVDRAGTALNYESWTGDDVREFVASWSPRVRGWMATITDHELAVTWAAELKGAGRYVFPPLPAVEIGSRVRLLGDGPSSWTCWVVVARPRTAQFMKWGALGGAYVVPPGENGGKVVQGGKPLWLMRALVRDYSRPGDLVCDPCAGGGTTLLAAAIEGRRAIGAEMMREHYDIAQKRIAKGYTPSLFGEEPANANTQQSLFTGTEDK